MNLLAELDHQQVARIGELIITAWQAGKDTGMSLHGAMKKVKRAEADAADNALYLRKWAKDIREHDGRSVDADRLDSIAEEIDLLRNLLAAYVADEDRFNRGHGEPYGSIPTEVGMLARAAAARSA